VRLRVSWPNVEERLRQIAEGATPDRASQADEVLFEFGLVFDGGLTSAGHELYMAKFVLQDEGKFQAALRQVLESVPLVSAFCEPLWSVDSIPVAGATSLLRRLTGGTGDSEARRWLVLMNKAGMIVYNPSKPTVSVTFNPAEIVSDADDIALEKTKGHVISPERPFGNVLALRSMLRAATGEIRWYEKHMGSKTLEVLYREIASEQVGVIRLLCGPPTPEKLEGFKSDAKRFRKEMKDQRGILVEVRVLKSSQAFKHHDRFFIADEMSRNLPPVNSILANSTGEILPSELTADDFDEWWSKAVELSQYAD
jgi:hypothetical protein